MTGGRGLQGHLDLVCGLDDRGQSTILRQSFRAPLHLGKPWHDGETLIVNIVNQTAGLLAGDVIVSNISVERDARLLVTTPSASRAHRTDSGEIFLQQNFRVAEGGWLEVYPELFIPQAGTTCHQHTRIDLAPGGALLYLDALAPGRVASGESFQYRALDWRTDLFHGERQLARERSHLVPGSPSLLALRNVFPNAYYGTVYLIAPRLSAPPLQELSALHDATLWIGVTELGPDAWALKLLASDSPTLRQAMRRIRENIYRSLGRPEPLLRKL